MTRSELVNKFLKFEADNLLFGYDIWYCLRLEIYRAIEYDIFKTAYMPVYIRQPAEISGFKGVPTNKSILVINNAGRFVKVGEREVNPTTQLLCDLFSQSVCQCSIDFKRGYALIGCGDEIMQIERSTGADFFSPLPVEIIKRFEMHFEIADKELFEKVVFNLHEYTERVFSLRAAFKKLISAVSPKLIVFENAYNPFFIMLVSVAKQLNIISVEMQHGHFDGIHVAFNVLPQAIKDCRSKINCPDYLFTYGEYYRNCARFFQNTDRVINVGNCFFESFADHAGKNNLKYDLLFISSTNSKAIRRYAVNLSAANKDLKILYRFHPEEKHDPSAEEELRKCGIAVEYPSERNVYAALKSCEKVITYNSTVTYEALCVGKRVGIIADDYNEIDDELKSAVTVIACAADLHEFAVRENDTSGSATNIFFADNCRANLYNAVMKLLKGM